VVVGQHSAEQVGSTLRFATESITNAAWTELDA
jgi:hypothetical protein